MDVGLLSANSLEQPLELHYYIHTQKWMQQPHVHDKSGMKYLRGSTLIKYICRYSYQLPDSSMHLTEQYQQALI